MNRNSLTFLPGEERSRQEPKFGSRREPLATRRSCTRFPIVARVVCSWGRKYERRVVEGLTRDISVKGLFVASPDSPPVSAVVRCQVALPPLSGAAEPSTPVVLRGIGRVVRTDERRPGFAIRMRTTPVLWDSESLPATP